jgi:hypothetical protein
VIGYQSADAAAGRYGETSPKVGTRVNESGPTVRLLLTVVVVAAACAACGKKGPPLAPFPRVPAKVDNLVPTRIGDDVVLTFPVPSANVDGRKPADLGALEIYGITTTRVPETPEEKKLATLLATLTVRPVLPEPPPDAPADVAESLAKAVPGLDQGGQAVFSETLNDELRAPVELPKKKDAIEPAPVVASDETPIGPIVMPLDLEGARRYYFVVPVSPRGREGPPSNVVSVPFGEPGMPPGQPAIDYTAAQMTLKWEPPPGAKTWTIAPVVPPPPPPPKPVTPPDEPADPSQPAVSPAPPIPPAPPVLAVKSLGFNTQATLYHVYEVPAMSSTQSAPVPGTVTIAKPLTPQPIDKNEFVIRNVTFGVRRCFYVRPVDVIFGMSVQGPASPESCITAVDTFAPQAPRSLAAIAGSAVINLIWDANTESDLAGYIVLRGEAPGDRLLPLTPAPIRETTYRDTTVQTGVRYVYAVIAVDNATPPNQSPQSARTEETARQ